MGIFVQIANLFLKISFIGADALARQVRELVPVDTIVHSHLWTISMAETDQTKHDSQDGASPEDGRSQGGPMRRFWSGCLNRWRLVLGLGVGVVLIGVVMGVGFAFLISQAEQAVSQTMIERALEKLSEGDLIEATDLAHQLARREKIPEEEAGSPAFILGMIAYDNGMAEWPKGGREAFLLTSKYLEVAVEKGIPEDQHFTAYSALGKSFYFSGQTAASRPWLKKAISLAADPQAKASLRYLWVEATLEDAEADFEETLGENGAFLKLEDLSPSRREQGMIQKGKILLKMGQRDASLRLLDKMVSDRPIQGPAAAEIDLLRAEALLQETKPFDNEFESQEALSKDRPSSIDQAERRRNLEEAIRLLRQAIANLQPGQQAVGRAMYLIGVGLEELGDFPATLKQWDRLRKAFPNSPEALASRYAEAVHYFKEGQDEQLLLCFRKVLEAIGEWDAFSNPWLTLDQIRRRSLKLYDYFQSKGAYEKALALLKSAAPLFDRERLWTLQAQTGRHGGDSLIVQAKTAETPEERRILLRKGRFAYREAGWTFERLARLHEKDRRHPDLVWETAQCYLQGHDFTNAEKQFQKYLKIELVKRQPQALLGLGKALMSLEKWDEALTAFDEGIDFYPNHVDMFQARLLSAQVCRELVKLDEAKRRLEANLLSSGITPRSGIWKQTLFELGQLLHDTGQFDEAIRRLDEMVRRYPDSSESILAEYLLADSHRRKGLVIYESLEKEVVENARLEKQEQLDKHLAEAYRIFQEVQEKIAHKQQETPLFPLEEKLFRNSQFFAAQVLFRMARYDSAVKSYSSIANRYQNRPVSLEAYLQMARIYLRLDRPLRAKRAIEQAKWMFDRLPENGPYAQTTNFDRAGWKQLLDSFEQTEL